MKWLMSIGISNVNRRETEIIFSNMKKNSNYLLHMNSLENPDLDVWGKNRYDN